MVATQAKAVTKISNRGCSGSLALMVAFCQQAGFAIVDFGRRCVANAVMR